MYKQNLLSLPLSNKQLLVKKISYGGQLAYSPQACFMDSPEVNLSHNDKFHIYIPT